MSRGDVSDPAHPGVPGQGFDGPVVDRRRKRHGKINRRSYFSQRASVGLRGKLRLVVTTVWSHRPHPVDSPTTPNLGGTKGGRSDGGGPTVTPESVGHGSGK